MSESYLKVAKKSEIQIGKTKKVTIGNQDILIANVDGNFYAIANKCTHRGGDLSAGVLEGKVITCPVHGAKFDVTTGISVSGPKMGLFHPKTANEPTYSVKVEGEDILVKPA